MNTVIAHHDGTGTVTIEGQSHSVTTPSVAEARQALLNIVATHAATTGRPVRVLAEEGNRTWPLVVHPDGLVQTDIPDSVAEATQSSNPRFDSPAPVTHGSSAVSPASQVTPPSAPVSATSASGVPSHPSGRESAPTPPVSQLPEPVPASPVVPASSQPVPHHAPVVGEAVPARMAAPARQLPPEQVDQDGYSRRSFLADEQIAEPATIGWRGTVNRLGLRLGPNTVELAERVDAQAVSQHWPGPRTIAIVNGKGGAGKTPTTVLLSAVFARYGGAGVLAWDNNQTRGTLGWRTEQGPHDATLLDLLPQVERLLGTGAQSADLAHFVHHQSRDRFDVLRSKPMALAQEQRVEPEDVDAIWKVAAKYYRLIFIDSGNDESDPMWLRMIDHTDQLVLATTTRDDHAEAGALLLEALAARDHRSARLANQAVVVVTQADSKAPAVDVQRVAAGYESLARAAVTIPFDPAMVDGLLRHGSLRANTQRAWLAAAAAIAEGL